MGNRRKPNSNSLQGTPHMSTSGEEPRHSAVQSSYENINSTVAEYVGSTESLDTTGQEDLAEPAIDPRTPRCLPPSVMIRPAPHLSSASGRPVDTKPAFSTATGPICGNDFRGNHPPGALKTSFKSQSKIEADHVEVGICNEEETGEGEEEYITTSDEEEENQQGIRAAASTPSAMQDSQSMQRKKKKKSSVLLELGGDGQFEEYRAVGEGQVKYYSTWERIIFVPIATLMLFFIVPFVVMGIIAAPIAWLLTQIFCRIFCKTLRAHMSRITCTPCRMCEIAIRGKGRLWPPLKRKRRKKAPSTGAEGQSTSGEHHNASNKTSHPDEDDHHYGQSCSSDRLDHDED